MCDEIILIIVISYIVIPLSRMSSQAHNHDFLDKSEKDTFESNIRIQVIKKGGVRAPGSGSPAIPRSGRLRGRPLSGRSPAIMAGAAKAAEFTTGFEHCIDMLLDLGRLNPNYNYDGRVDSLKEINGSDRTLTSVTATSEELSAEEFWHLVSTDPSTVPGAPRYPGWVPRILRSIDTTPVGLMESLMRKETHPDRSPPPVSRRA